MSTVTLRRIIMSRKRPEPIQKQQSKILRRTFLILVALVLITVPEPTGILKLISGFLIGATIYGI